MSYKLNTTLLRTHADTMLNVALMIATIGVCSFSFAVTSEVSEDQYAELVENNTRQLTNVIVKEARKTGGNWVMVSGVAYLRDDLIIPIDAERGAALCRTSAKAYELAVRDLLVYEPGPLNGQRVEFRIEMVARKLGEEEQKLEKTKSGSFRAPTSGGWVAGAYRKDLIKVDGHGDSLYLNIGYPPAFYSPSSKPVELIILDHPNKIDLFCDSFSN